ncbi:MAG: sugar phosphate nucleotidyltransferase [Alphaproteobacteria bacterium]
MLGILQIDQAWSQISGYFTDTPYENVFLVDSDGRLVREMSQPDWRDAMLLDFDHGSRIGEILPFVDASLRARPRSAVERAPAVAAALPHLNALLDRSGKVVEVTPRTTTALRRPAACGLVMAGGLGRRLGALTEHTPKPMLEVAGRPIAEHLVRSLVDNGVTDIVLSLCHLPDIIRTYFGDGSRFGCRIRYTVEERPLGTGGCLSLLPHDLEGPLVMVNGDVVTDLQFARLIAFHERHGNDITMAIRPHAVTVPYGVVDHEHGAVTRIREKPRMTYHINAAIYVLSERARAQAPHGVRMDLPSLIEKVMPLDMRVAAFPLVETWIDVGSPVELQRARDNYEPARRPALMLSHTAPAYARRAAASE